MSAESARRKVAFTDADVQRAIKAVEKGGKSIMGVDFPPEGGFRLLIGSPLSSPVRFGGNEWDEVLPQ